MKDDVVRARISADLKAQAQEVLASHGLEMSDAIRLFLHQVVRVGGLPFQVRDPGVRVVSAKRLWDMKREAQAQDRAAAKSGKLPPEARVLIQPRHLKGAKIHWPKGSLK